MAFDAGMLAASLAEIRKTAIGARVERVFMPARDEIVLALRLPEGGKRLLINAGANHPRVGFSEIQKENPPVPPMFCMLLRKHLQGAKLSGVRQAGFERVAILEFDARDEMGFSTVRKLYCEMMGKYSNLIFADEADKILSVLNPVDFSTSSRRQVLPGMTYELPPSQNKTDPTAVSLQEFETLFSAASPEGKAEKWILSTFSGISAAVAREIVFAATGSVDTLVSDCNAARLEKQFFGVVQIIREEKFSPCMISNEGEPVEYAFLPLLQYTGYEMQPFSSAGELLDAFFGAREKAEAIRRRAADISYLIGNAEARIAKKLHLQRAELAECEKGEQYKKQADLITANLHAIPKGASRAELTDYEDSRPDGSFGVCAVGLDPRPSPAANAQRLYKKYNKSKNARVELTRQIALGEEELAYLETVNDSLSRAENSADLAEVREELFRAGFASRMKHYAAPKKQTAPAVAEFRTSGGYRVLCGKNNLQNEYITQKLAGKTDYWFHVKNRPGSHVVLFAEGKEPPERDFTDAAEIAAFYSSAEGGNIEVDYTIVKNVRKPAGGKPGFVIYHTNWSCVVTPNESKIISMRVK